MVVSDIAQGGSEELTDPCAELVCWEDWFGAAGIGWSGHCEDTMNEIHATIRRDNTKFKTRFVVVVVVVLTFL